jgi:hypothetical protein
MNCIFRDKILSLVRRVDTFKYRFNIVGADANRSEKFDICDFKLIFNFSEYQNNDYCEKINYIDSKSRA